MFEVIVYPQLNHYEIKVSLFHGRLLYVWWQMHKYIVYVTGRENVATEGAPLTEVKAA